jgi:hypothetical protein
MRYIKFRTFSEASALNDRVTAECLRASVWTDGTNNYCNPDQDANGMWRVPILEGYEMFFTTGEIDRAWDDANPVPREVPTWRLRAVLAIDGKEADVQNAISSLPDPNKTIAQRAWDFGSNTERTSQTVAFIKGVLSLTDAEVDAYFIQANDLQA